MPPPRKKGGARKVIGVLLVVFGAMPLLGSGAITAKAVSNARIQVANDAFVPKAWHNLPADQFFPDWVGLYRGFTRYRGTTTYEWARQGIDEASTCEDPGLEPKLADAVQEHGCQAVVRATYVDSSETLVTTIVVAVVGSAADAASVYDAADRELEMSISDPVTHPGQLALAFPVADTPAEDWADEDRGGVAIGRLRIGGSEDPPYVAVATVGYVDGRYAGELPEPWTSPSPGSANERALNGIADEVLTDHAERVMLTIMELRR